MKVIKIFSIAIVLLICCSINLKAQDGMNSSISTNTGLASEIISVNSENSNSSRLLELERMHKQAMKNGNESEAMRIENEMNLLLPEENRYVKSETGNGPVVIDRSHTKEPLTTDWQSLNSIVSNGSITPTSYSAKHIEVKVGEDNCLYALINKGPYGTYNGLFEVRRSSDYGLSWNSVIGILSPEYVIGATMVVESKLNSNPDSTRITIMYIKSFGYNLNKTELWSYSVRANSTGNESKIISSFIPGYKFTQVSSFSDGAFWESATYFGVVATVADTLTGVVNSLKYFRTINWGATWASSTINTSNNDAYISAAYKEGTLDSVYIAVERKLGANSQIRVISTPFNPSSSFSTYLLTSAAGMKYEKPCITIKQNNPADSILITCTKNGSPVYHFTSNAGATWTIDWNLGSSNGSNKSFTYCSSTPNGPSPFSACWISNDGDSINVRRGILGNMGPIVYKVNSEPSILNVPPACVTFNRFGSNNTAVVYSDGSRTLSSMEAFKTLTLKAFPQAFYNSSSKRLNMRDTITVIARSPLPPYSIVDWENGIIDSVNYEVTIQFTNLNDGNYYLSTYHRNSIETWSNSPVNFQVGGVVNLDMTSVQSSAYGSNLIQVDNSPSRFGIYSGDPDHDGTVDLSDIALVYNDANNFVTGYKNSDINGDRFTDLTDLVVTFNNSLNFVSKITP